MLVTVISFQIGFSEIRGLFNLYAKKETFSHLAQQLGREGHFILAFIEISKLKKKNFKYYSCKMAV